MRTRIVSSLLYSVIAIGVLGAETKPAIKNIQISQTSPTSGKEMFSQYCAVCHGVDGKGDGPAAAALKTAPTDLTQIAKHNGGSFPDRAVILSIGSSDIAAHGSKEMPIWGDLFKSLGSNSGVVQIRLANLTKYVKSIQAK